MPVYRTVSDEELLRPLIPVHMSIGSVIETDLILQAHEVEDQTSPSPSCLITKLGRFGLGFGLRASGTTIAPLSCVCYARRRACHCYYPHCLVEELARARAHARARASTRAMFLVRLDKAIVLHEEERPNHHQTHSCQVDSANLVEYNTANNAKRDPKGLEHGVNRHGVAAASRRYVRFVAPVSQK